VFGVVSAIHRDVVGIKMTCGYSCLLFGILLSEISETKRKELKVRVKERKNKRKEDIYEENRTV
jgi:hypothetical protein